jgi:hypothetical protein
MPNRNSNVRSQFKLIDGTIRWLVPFAVEEFRASARNRNHC